MSNSNMCEGLPSYLESVTRPGVVLEHTITAQSDETSSSTASDAPPAFSLSPIKLILPPQSTLIKPTYREAIDARAVYELTAPLNGHNRSVYIAEVPTITRLNKHGHLPTIEKRHHLYKIFETSEGSQRHTAIDGRKTRSVHGTILRRSADGTALVATNHGDTWGSQGELIYCARQSGEVIEWLDARGRLVAIDHRGLDRNSLETLEVLVPLNKKWLDMLVAVWISRIHQDTQREGAIEDEERRREKEERRGRSNSGRPQSLIQGGKSFLRTFTA